MSARTYRIPVNTRMRALLPACALLAAVYAQSHVEMIHGESGTIFINATVNDQGAFFNGGSVSDLGEAIRSSRSTVNGAVSGPGVIPGSEGGAGGDSGSDPSGGEGNEGGENPNGTITMTAIVATASAPTSSSSTSTSTRTTSRTPGPKLSTSAATKPGSNYIFEMALQLGVIAVASISAFACIVL